MKVLVLGATGMLGSDVVSELQARGQEIEAPSSSEVDLTDPQSVAAVSQMTGVDWCVNCAAYTAVDLAESEEQTAAELNALGPGYLARVCAMKGIKLLHISTDFVFDGENAEPYDELAATHPLGIYGRTKLAGEEAVFAALPAAVIFRTAWLYGPNGKSFPKTIIGAWLAGKELRVVADQIGNPTYTKDLARTIVDALEKNIFPGTYHVTGPDAMSWFDLALRAVHAYRDAHGIDRPIEISAIGTDQWPTPARRPKFSVLSNAKLHSTGLAPMRSAELALKDFVRQIGGYPA